MKEKEKYGAQIKARLMKFGESLYEIAGKESHRKAGRPDIQIAPTLKKQEAAEAKLRQLDEADDSSWEKFKTELDQQVDGIDTDVRKALAYFG